MSRGREVRASGRRTILRVTVGMLVRNGGAYIRQPVGSPLSQSFGDFQLAISHNDSADSTEVTSRDLVAEVARVSDKVGAIQSCAALQSWSGRLKSSIGAP